MRIIAKRPFISSKQGIGNVPEGRILDIDSNYANMLIKAGLAEQYSASSPFLTEKKTLFLTPNSQNS
jgi:hypothetical protein